MSDLYTEENAAVIDRWVRDGWEWGRPIDHDTFFRAKVGDWSVLLTPVKPVPHEWFCRMEGAEILGLASGGGQQMPVFSALGARCTVLDYSEEQLRREIDVSKRDGYEIRCVRADMTKPLPFADGTFDLIFHPVSNTYVQEVEPIWRECFRVLKRGGILLAGLDNGLNFAYDEEETGLCYRLPFNALKDRQVHEDSVKNDWAIQFSHTIEEQIGGQLKAGFRLTDIYGDTNGQGNLYEHNIPTFYATRAVKP